MNGRQGLTLGIILVLVGAYLLLQNVVSWHGPGPVLFLLGTALFTASALRRFRGPLLPGAVLLGLGSAFLLEHPLEPWLPHWSTLLLGIAAGLLLVAGIDMSVRRTRRPAPAVVGVILIAVVAASAVGRALDPRTLEPLARLWPWLLVVAGAVLIVRAVRR
ncbi:MAG TPA: hypothetical protein VJA66_05425 [Thermoanaerobaculia bacterium]